ncbi:MAG: Ig-like domain-containing protein [Gemmatimonadota bacterium]
MTTSVAFAAILALSSVPLHAQQQPERRVAIDPAEAQIEVGSTRQFGTGPVSGPVQWLSTDAEVARVDSTGTVTALRPGTVRILVLAGDRQGEATVRVPALPPADVVLRAGATDVLAGTSVPLDAVVRDRQGTVLDTRIEFSTDRPNIAAVDASGRLIAHAPGTATVTARAGTASTSAPVNVRANTAREYRITPSVQQTRTGDVTRFRVVATGATGAEVGPILPAWSVEGAGAHIEAEGADGVFVAERPGRYTVTAYVGPQIVQRTTLEVASRTHEGELVRVGHGLTVGHHAGDTWAFEGVDGRDYAIIGTYLHDWAKVFDITDPAAPVLTDSVKLDARRINDVKIHPNNLIGVLTREGASTRRNGIVLLDLSTPAHPTILSEHTDGITGGVHNVWIVGEEDLIYAVHNGTRDVRIIDIADPRAPREVGGWRIEREDRSLHDVIVQDGYAYLSYWDDGLIMLDAGAGTHGGTARAPTFVSQFKYPEGNTHTAWRHGRYLFVGDEIFPPDWDASQPIRASGYIHVLDYSDPENPVEVAKYEVPESGVHNFWAEDDILYIGNYQAGLRVLDISGELRGDLYRQGREMGSLLTASKDAVTPNWSMTWGAQIFKGNIITSDLNSGLWIAKFVRGNVVF